MLRRKQRRRFTPKEVGADDFCGLVKCLMSSSNHRQ